MFFSMYFLISKIVIGEVYHEHPRVVITVMTSFPVSPEAMNL